MNSYRIIPIVIGLLVFNLAAILVALIGGFWWPLMLTLATLATIIAIALVTFSAYGSSLTQYIKPEEQLATAGGAVLQLEPEGAPSQSTEGLSIEGAEDTQASLTSTKDPLDDRRWLRLVEECVELFDEMDRHGPDFDPPRREVAEHVCLRLREILERSGVEPVEGASKFDRFQHQTVGVTASVAQGASVAETLSPGFRVGRRILRRARVRIG